MKRFFALSLGLIFVGSTLVSARDEIAPPAGKQKQIQIAKPFAPVGKPQYKVSVQAKPKFAGEERPKASEPASQNGLSVTIQPEQKKFAGNGPLAFEVTLSNTSKKPFLLYRGATLGEEASLVISNQKTAVQWKPGSPAIAKRGGVVSVPPGKSVTYSLVVEQQFVALPVPFPRPFPQPIPRVLPIERRQKAQAGAALQVKVKRRRPAILPVFVGPVMPCGKGTCRAKLMMEFKGDPLGKYATPLWTGKIATGTVEFEVGAPKPGNPIIIGPPVGGPLTKEQAITFAQAAAERALDANYKPIDGIRPAHTGSWIDNPQKTATAKKNKDGGWRVSWTQVPKGKGHRFNVTVLVGARGGARVQEVFTGYSPR